MIQTINSTFQTQFKATVTRISDNQIKNSISEEVQNLINEATSTGDINAMKAADAAYLYYFNGGGTNIKTQYDANFLILLSTARAAITGANSKNLSQLSVMNGSKWLKKTIDGSLENNDVEYHNEFLYMRNPTDSIISPDNANYIVLYFNKSNNATCLSVVEKDKVDQADLSTIFHNESLGIKSGMLAGSKGVKNVSSLINEATFFHLLNLTNFNLNLDVLLSNMIYLSCTNEEIIKNKVNTMAIETSSILSLSGITASSTMKWQTKLLNGSAAANNTTLYAPEILYTENPNNNENYLVLISMFMNSSEPYLVQMYSIEKDTINNANDTTNFTGTGGILIGKTNIELPFLFSNQNQFEILKQFAQKNINLGVNSTAESLSNISRDLSNVSNDLSSLLFNHSSWFKQTTQKTSDTDNPGAAEGTSFGGDFLMQQDHANINNFIIVYKEITGSRTDIKTAKVLKTIVQGDISNKPFMTAVGDNSGILNIAQPSITNITDIITPDQFDRMVSIASNGPIDPGNARVIHTISAETNRAVFEDWKVKYLPNSALSTHYILFSEYTVENNSYMVLFHVKENGNDLIKTKVLTRAQLIGLVENDISVMTSGSTNITGTFLDLFGSVDKFRSAINIISDGTIKFKEDPYQKWKIRHMSTNNLKTPYVLFSESLSDSTKFVVLFHKDSDIYTAEINKEDFIGYNSEDFQTIVSSTSSIATANKDFETIDKFKLAIEVISGMSSNIFNSIYVAS